MCALAKFQPDMPITSVKALKSGSNKKIHLYRKHWENKLQVRTKMDVTYEWNVTQSCKLHHCACYKQEHLLQGKSPLRCTQIKSVKNNRLHTIVST